MVPHYGKGAVLKLNVNGKAYEVEVEPDTPLLWVLRDLLGLKGTKFGCGLGQCGACTVHMNGKALKSCMMPVSNAEPHAITTIEGLSSDGSHPVQQAWIEHAVPQCGYCQSGQIMAASALLERIPSPTEEQVAQSMTNICRCGTYPRIKKAIAKAAESMGGSNE